MALRNRFPIAIATFAALLATGVACRVSTTTRSGSSPIRKSWSRTTVGSTYATSHGQICEAVSMLFPLITAPPAFRRTDRRSAT